MRLWRDVFGTVVTLIGLAIGFSVTQGWNWPIVGTSVTMGIIGTGVVSLVACATSGWIGRVGDSGMYRDPWMIVAMLLGAAILVVGITGLFVGMMLYLIVMMVGIALLWVVTTAHHILAPEGPSERRLATPA